MEAPPRLGKGRKWRWRKEKKEAIKFRGTCDHLLTSNLGGWRTLEGEGCGPRWRKLGFGLTFSSVESSVPRVVPGTWWVPSKGLLRE